MPIGRGCKNAVLSSSFYYYTVNDEQGSVIPLRPHPRGWPGDDFTFELLDEGWPRHVVGDVATDTYNG